jgi:hypothetical protein
MPESIKIDAVRVIIENYLRDNPLKRDDMVACVAHCRSLGVTVKESTIDEL